MGVVFHCTALLLSQNGSGLSLHSSTTVTKWEWSFTAQLYYCHKMGVVFHCTALLLSQNGSGLSLHSSTTVTKWEWSFTAQLYYCHKMGVVFHCTALMGVVFHWTTLHSVQKNGSRLSSLSLDHSRCCQSGLLLDSSRYYNKVGVVFCWATLRVKTEWSFTRQICMLQKCGWPFAGPLEHMSKKGSDDHATLPIVVQALHHKPGKNTQAYPERNKTPRI